jgi:predicted esterase
MFLEEELITNGNPSKPKPAILCLHGGGTNSTIFDIQTVRLQRVLNPYFEFVFLDGPLYGEPGPGVVPVFEGLEPYRRWLVKGAEEKPAVTDTLLRDVIEEQKRKDGRGFVGVLGFSQGAKIAAGLLLEQQVRQGKDGVDGRREGFKFGVLFNGTTPPLTANLTYTEKGERVSIPSLHVVGRDDPWREEGLELYEKHFDQTTARLMEFAVGHRLPVLAEDTAKTTDEILRMYEEAEGSRQRDLSTPAE